MLLLLRLSMPLLLLHAAAAALLPLMLLQLLLSLPLLMLPLLLLLQHAVSQLPPPNTMCKARRGTLRHLVAAANASGTSTGHRA